MCHIHWFQSSPSFNLSFTLPQQFLNPSMYFCIARLLSVVCLLEQILNCETGVQYLYLWVHRGATKKKAIRHPQWVYSAVLHNCPSPLPAQIFHLHTPSCLPRRAVCTGPEHWHETARDSESLSLDYRLKTTDFQELQNTDQLHGRIFKGNMDSAMSPRGLGRDRM